MTPKIKRRLDRIRCGEVPEGYKRTKAGIMSCEWCYKKEFKAKDVFRSVTNKKHNGQFEVLSVTQERGVIPRNEVDIDIKFDRDNVTEYKKVDKGDFVISLRSFQGGIEYSEYEGLVSPAYTVLKPVVPICDGYYKAYLKSADFINRLNRGTYGIRDGKQIGFVDFGEMMIHYPPIAEQEKIAEILSTQDKLIELQKHKIEELKKLKKAYLSKMCPRRGSNVPELRFKGFADAWEQRKLGEMGTTFSGLSGKTNEDFGHGDGRFVTYMNVFLNPVSNLVRTESVEVDNTQNLVQYGDVFFTTSSETPEEVGMSSVWLGNATQL